MTATLKGNWNYPTKVWSGPGRIAELPAACEAAGLPVVRGRKAISLER